MSALIEWLQLVYKYLALIPLVPFFLIWGIVFFISRDKRKATHRAIDVTTLFLIGSVSIVSRYLFNSDIGFWGIILVFLIVCGLVGNLQERKKGKVNPFKITKTLLRFGFIFLSGSYALLLCIGIGKYILFS
ncbi:DUF3397 domain-containing protein [Paenibacillus periandrae]|uniref:DUF3397 domain-containing protein n=1 Tax=Paenibacillus periandrae TaxID=1761741 RepID=UPI001F0898A5|nr:DUF3397 domain-containing protein [Paenibacillus periandrae]